MRFALLLAGATALAGCAQQMSEPTVVGATVTATSATATDMADGGATAPTVTVATVAPTGDGTVAVMAATTDDACNSAAYQQYVGQRSPAISLPAGTEMRHYRTGDPVTADMIANRLNFEYDRRGTLVRVTCG